MPAAKETEPVNTVSNTLTVPKVEAINNDLPKEFRSFAWHEAVNANAFKNYPAKYALLPGVPPPSSGPPHPGPAGQRNWGDHSGRRPWPGPFRYE